MKVRWLYFTFVLLAACHHAIDATATVELNELRDEAKSSVDSDLYETLLRYVADNAFNNNNNKDASSKADHYYDELDQSAGESNANNQDIYYYYPVVNKASTKATHYGGQKHKAKDKDVLWQIVESLGKNKFKFEEALFDWLADTQHGHRPSYPVGGHGDYGLSKGDVFTKVKLLAIASTALLITLGGLILLAPLLVAKGRAARRALFESTEFNDLTGRVVDAIQTYKFQN